MRVEARLAHVETSSVSFASGHIGSGSSGQVAQTAWFTFSFLHNDNSTGMSVRAVQGNDTPLNDSGRTLSLKAIQEALVAVYPETAEEREWATHAKMYNGE